MKLAMTRPRLAGLAAWALGAGLLWPLQAHALFGDDEARKAIIELRQTVQEHQQANQEAQAAVRRSLLELQNQHEALRAEVAHLRGQNEQLMREVSELQRQQKDVKSGIDERLRQIEPLSVTLDGFTFTAEPAEKRDFEAAMQALRDAKFEPAAMAFAAFLQRYPNSGYTPSGLYWLGNAHYASRAYKKAIATHRKLVSDFAGHLRAPEALLAIANSELEIKDNRNARRSLEELIKTYPDSEAAVAGRERLAQMPQTR